jgi:hypothetical protein
LSYGHPYALGRPHGDAGWAAHLVPSPRCDHPAGLPAGSEAGFITGEQQTRATGIA